MKKLTKLLSLLLVFALALGIVACSSYGKVEKALKDLGYSVVENEKQAEEYKDVIKMGRTEMQDAVPISFEQVFSAYASALSRDVKRLDLSIEEMQKLNLGGTAIGTCINATHEYVISVVDVLKEVTSLELTQAEDLVDATQNLDGFVFVSGNLKALAVTLSKIANDLRLMSSGPRTGFGEITLKPMQNGSSIMPGKVNPVIPEAISQIAYQVIGNDTTVTLSCEAGQLELNAFEPIVFRQLFESLKMLTNGIEMFKTQCIETLIVNKENCDKEVHESIGIVTALCPKMGYKKCSEIAKKALKERKRVRDVIVEEGILTKEELSKIVETGDFIVNEKDKVVNLTEAGVDKVEKFFHIDNLADAEHLEIQHHVKRQSELSHHRRFQLRRQRYIYRQSSQGLILKFYYMF